MRIAYFLLLAALFSYSSLSAQSETTYDVEFECICLIDSIAPDTIVQFWRFTQANNPGALALDYTFDLAGLYTAAGNVMGCNDYYLGDNVNTGGGTAGTLPIWTGVNALGNSSITESGGNVVGTSFTGAFGLAVGTNAQQPVGANGRIRYSTTGNGVQAWNGSTSSYLYLPWAAAPAFTNQAIPRSNGTNLVESGIFFSSLNSGTVTYSFASQIAYVDFVRGSTSDHGIRYRSNANITIEPSANTANYHTLLAPGNVQNNQTSPYTTKALGAYFSNRSIALAGGGGVSIATVPNLWGVRSEILGVQSDLVSNIEVGPLVIRGPRKSQPYNTGYNGKAGNVVVVGGLIGSGDDPGNVILAHNGTSDSDLYGRVGVGIYVPTSDFDLNGKARIRILPDSLYQYEVRSDANGRLARQVGSFVGTISTSTDASGDIVVAHGMGTTPTSVQVTVTGTTPYVVTVHSIDGTNFTVRFYDMAGAAVASTAVTATWHAKT